jgi:Mn2+/Fe2+ NRAMP family transporter
VSVISLLSPSINYTERWYLQSVNKKWDEAKEFYFLYTGILILAGAIILIPGAPLIFISLWSQVLNGMLLPVVLVCMILLVNNKKIMGEYVNKPLNNLIGWSAVVILIVLTFVMLLMPLIGKL